MGGRLIDDAHREEGVVCEEDRLVVLVEKTRIGRMERKPKVVEPNQGDKQRLRRLKCVGKCRPKAKGRVGNDGVP